MPRNIEIKARLTDMEATEKCLADLSIQKSAIIRQSDVFYKSPNGRLKLRRFTDHRGELIFYQRAVQKGPKTSRYQIYRTEDPDGLQKILDLAYPVLGEVHKTRNLYLTGQTRIHLDRVEHLGDFLELEVVLKDRQSSAEGMQTARDLMHNLGIKDEDCLAEAYIDLLSKNLSTD